MQTIDFDTFARTNSWIQGIDPRVRLVVAAMASLLVATTHNPYALIAALIITLLTTLSARLPLIPLAKRLAGINAFMIMLLLVMPLSVPGPAAFTVGPLHWSWPGLIRALTIMVRGNSIILIMTALVSTIGMVQMGHALAHLRLPAKLVSMLMFSVRYHHVLLEEYHRLLRAARVRGFVMRPTARTYRTVGQLVGMLLVRSVDRSTRILTAMTCRGYRGRFYLLDHFRLRKRDLAFAALAATTMAALLALSRLSS